MKYQNNHSFGKPQAFKQDALAWSLGCPKEHN